MLKRKFSRNLSLDEAAHGVYIERASTKVAYNFKKLFDYCWFKGIKQPSELNEEELKKFEIR